MPHFIQSLNDQTLCATVSGLLTEADRTALHDASRELIGKMGKINVMFILQNFEGFSNRVDWGNLDFYAEHADDILRMAVVGDPKWESQLSVFTGRGTRATEIRFYTPPQLKPALAWLASPTS